MREQLQSYNAKYKVLKNTEITAFLLFCIFFPTLEKEIKEE